MRVKAGDNDWVDSKSTPCAVQLSDAEIMQIIKHRFAGAMINGIYAQAPEGAWKDFKAFDEWVG
jgi:hypothetical protein